MDFKNATENVNIILKVALEQPEYGMRLNDLSVGVFENKKPNSLPDNKMAVYSFWYGDVCLKVGQAGKNSNSRYQEQHYKTFLDKKNRSSLARSLAKDSRFKPVLDEKPLKLRKKEDGTIEESDVKELDKKMDEWMSKNLSRIDIIIAATNDNHSNKIILNAIEGVLQHAFLPVYENGSSDKELIYRP